MSLRIAIVGAGLMGGTHARAYSDPALDAKVAYVVDPDIGRASALAKQAEGAAATSSLDEALADSSIDIIDICTPGVLHHDIALQAAKSGKHVFCEKPIAISSQQAAEMIAICRAGNLRFMVAHVLRFWPEYAAAAAAVNAGRIGALRRVSCLRLSAAPAWSKDGWILNGKGGGGAVRDLAVHDFDFLNWLAGKPKNIEAKGDEKYFHAIMMMENGIIASVEASYALPPGYPFIMSFRLLGTEGALEFDSRVGGLKLYPGSGGCIELQTASEAFQQGGPSGKKDAYQAEIAHFLQCVREGRDSDRLKADDAVIALEISLAVESALA